LDIKSFADVKLALEAVEQCKSSPIEPLKPDEVKIFAKVTFAI